MKGNFFSKAALFFFTGLLLALFCAAFFPLRADHDCTHDEYCSGCLQARELVNLLKQMEPVYARLAAAAVFGSALVLFLKISSSGPALFTSITLKVRMNT
jgi:hypothetical protein